VELWRRFRFATHRSQAWFDFSCVNLYPSNFGLRRISKRSDNYAGVQFIGEIFAGAARSYGKSLICSGDTPMLDFAARPEGHSRPCKNVNPKDSGFSPDYWRFYSQRRRL
jgi:hypothetical protein